MAQRLLSYFSISGTSTSFIRHNHTVTTQTCLWVQCRWLIFSTIDLCPKINLFYRYFTIFIAVGIMQMSTFTFLSFKLGILKLTSSFLILWLYQIKTQCFWQKKIKVSSLITEKLHWSLQTNFVYEVCTFYTHVNSVHRVDSSPVRLITTNWQPFQLLLLVFHWLLNTVVQVSYHWMHCTSINAHDALLYLSTSPVQ